MNELDLIKEVESRPILYDKTVSGFNKTKLRDDAWKEVQEALHVSGEFTSVQSLNLTDITTTNYYKTTYLYYYF